MVQTPQTVAPASRKLASGFMLACAVAQRGGLEGTAVAGAIEPMAKPSAWFNLARRSDGAGLAGLVQAP